METFIRTALEKHGPSSDHEALSAILKLLKEQSVEELVNGKKGAMAYDNKIRNILNGCVLRNSGEEDKIVAEVSQLIYTLKSYLKQAVFEADVKALLIFLCANCYFELEAEKLLPENERKATVTIHLSRKVLELLKALNITPALLPGAPYHERKMVEDFLTGYADDNVSKTYKTIEAIERGGIGFHFNYLLELLIMFLYRFNYKCFIEGLLRLQNPTECVFYLQSLGKEALLKIAGETSLISKWLNFELIRQIIKNETKGHIDHEEVKAIKACLQKTYTTDYEFFKQAVKYFSKSCLFNSALGAFMVDGDEEKIEDLISKCFKIEKYSNNLESVDAFRGHFMQGASNKQLDLLDGLVYKKWKAFVGSLLVDPDAYQNDLMLTDYANYIVHYYTRQMEDNEIKDLINQFIDKIVFLDSEWTISMSEQITRFHLYHSELYLLTQVYRSKKIYDINIQERYEKLISDQVQQSRLVSNGEIVQYFQKGLQNICSPNV